MNNLVGARTHATGRFRTAALAGVAYTLVVFMFAFVIGTVRVLLVVPRLGALPAVMLEAPIVLAVSWLVASWCTRRLHVSLEPRVRVVMGAVAFLALMGLELGVAIFAFGDTLDHYFAKFASPAGIAGLVMQVGFATIPWVQGQLCTEPLEEST